MTSMRSFSDAHRQASPRSAGERGRIERPAKSGCELKRRWLAQVLAAAAALLMTALPAQAQPIPFGSAQRLVQAGTEPIEVFTYKPAGYEGGPLLLVLHDDARDAPRYRDHAIPIADAHGYLVAAPRLAGERFAQWRYAWAGIARRTFPDDGMVIEIEPRERTLDAALRPLIDTLRRADGGNLPYALLGDGAGAQALLRWAAFADNEAMHIVIVNPDAILLPTRRLDFPSGFGRLPGTMTGETRMRDYLALPITLLLGRVEPAGALEVSALGQGRNLLSAGQQAARERNRPLHWRLIEVPGVGRAAGAMLASKQALQALVPAFGDE